MSLMVFHRISSLQLNYMGQPGEDRDGAAVGTEMRCLVGSQEVRREGSMGPQTTFSDCDNNCQGLRELKNQMCHRVAIGSHLLTSRLTVPCYRNR